MPIDRPDGKHWCAPDQEQPNNSGVWACPGCNTSWTWLSSSEIVRTVEADGLLAARAAVVEKSG